MIYFFNRGLILEQEIVNALKKYFSLIRLQEYYKNYTITVTNEHPFASMHINTPDGEKASDTASRFPVVVVETKDDSKPAELSALGIDNTETIVLYPKDVVADNNGKSYIEKRYAMITPEIIRELREAMDAREDKRIFGATRFIRRRDRISIEIWTENPQLKNELYEIIRLFVCGFLRDYLSDLYKCNFNELRDGESPVAIFDSSVRGQRSNNYNVDFGIELTGAHITFDADYIIEQTMVDTQVVDTQNLLLEVINHVRGSEENTREWIVGPTDGGGGEPNDA